MSLLSALGFSEEEANQNVLDFASLLVGGVNEDGGGPIMAAMKRRGRNAILCAAVEKKDLAAVRAIVAREPWRVNEMNDIRATPLLVALLEGAYDIAHELLSVKGIDVNKTSPRLCTACTRAAATGQESILRKLVALGGDVNRKEYDPESTTPLAAAAEAGQESMVRVLLSLGAKPHVLGIPDEYQPEARARSKGHVKIADLLLAVIQAGGFTAYEENSGSKSEVGAEVVCALCAEMSAEMKRCGRCKAVHYCSRACQRIAWRDHKPVCEPCT